MTARVPKGHANGGQFTGRSNPPRGSSRRTVKHAYARARQQLPAYRSGYQAGKKARTKAKKPAQPSAPPPKKLTPLPEMVNRGDIGFQKEGPLGHNRPSDPTSPPDARLIRSLYGDDQIEQGLAQYLASSLRETARLMGIQHPGRTRAEIIRNIARTLRENESRAESIRRTREASNLLASAYTRADPRLAEKARPFQYGPPGGSRTRPLHKRKAKA